MVICPSLSPSLWFRYSVKYQVLPAMCPPGSCRARLRLWYPPVLPRCPGSVLPRQACFCSRTRPSGSSTMIKLMYRNSSGRSTWIYRFSVSQEPVPVPVQIVRFAADGKCQCLFHFITRPAPPVAVSCAASSASCAGTFSSSTWSAAIFSASRILPSRRVYKG